MIAGYPSPMKIRILRTGVAAFAAVTLVASPVCAQIMTGTSGAAATGGAGSGASASYRVGPGDLLSVTVYRSPDLQSQVRVDASGKIPFAALGEVEVGNMTASEIATMLAQGLKKKGILVDPSVNVLVTEIRAKTVMVMGSVSRPGEVPLDREGMTLATVLARSGASFGTGAGVVTVMENDDRNAPRSQYLISELVSGSKDRPAKSGEILVVQSAPTIYVSGEVGKPGAYPLEPNMTIGQALALGGGITPRGSRSRIRLTRKENGKTVEIKSVSFDTPVLPDDLIYVKQRLF